jgi:hypothetical protein
LLAPETDKEIEMSVLIRSTVIVVGAALAATASAAEQVSFRVTGPKGTVELRFQQRTLADDEAHFAAPATPSSPLTRRQDLIASEADAYQGSGYTPLDDNTDVNGYNIGANQPQHRQICGGLALARLLKGAYSVPTDQVWNVVSTLGEPVQGLPAVGDVAVWRTGDTVHHFGLVARLEDGTGFPVWVYSKDDSERVCLGPANTFPESKSYGQVSYHHLDWNSITATRVPSTADDGPDSIEIPDVDGLTAAEAYAKLAATGLPVSTTFLDNPPPGKNNTVIRVGKYRRLPRNSIIGLNVYGRAVPSVINKSSGDAVGTLETVGLKVIGITVVKA